MRVLAIDLGARHVGLAKSDPLRVISQPCATLDRRRGDEALMCEICALCDAEEVSEIVVGLPLHMDGREGEGAEDARRFAAALAQMSGRPVRLWDERLTTTAAHRHMTAIGTKTKHKKGKVDGLAAEMILQGYLRRLQARPAREDET